MTHTDLKPCAHCGHEARLCQWRDTLEPNATWAECPECGIMTDSFHHDDAEQAKALAAAVWNTRARTPDTAPSQSADLIAEAERWFDDPTGDEDALISDTIAYKLITALRAAEERAEVLQSELTEFLDIGYSLERIANLSEKWSDSLVRQINEIARDALDRRSTDYADALRAAEVENARLREALERIATGEEFSGNIMCIARRALGGSNET